MRNFITIRSHRHACFSKYDVVRCALLRILALENRLRVRHENSPRVAIHNYNVAKVSKIYNRIYVIAREVWESILFLQNKITRRTLHTWNFWNIGMRKIFSRGDQLNMYSIVFTFFNLFNSAKLIIEVNHNRGANKKKEKIKGIRKIGVRHWTKGGLLLAPSLSLSKDTNLIGKRGWRIIPLSPLPTTCSAYPFYPPSPTLLSASLVVYLSGLTPGAQRAICRGSICRRLYRNPI